MTESRPGKYKVLPAVSELVERDLISAILDTVGALVVVLDTRGRIAGFNRACERTTGYSAEEVAGKHLWDLLLTPEEVEPVKAVFGELRAGQFPNEYENFWVTRGGERRLITWSNTALLNDGGKAAYVIGTGIDITEHRQAEEALRESEEAWRSLTEYSPDHIMLLDREANILFVNRTLPELSWEQVIGTSFYDYALEEYRQTAQECFERVLRTGEPDRFESDYVDVNGNRMTFETHVGPVLRSGEVWGVTARSTDITERKEAERALERLSYELGERVKELHCLLGMSALVDEPGITLAEILEGTARLLPPAWQYPEIACARVSVDGQTFTTENFRETRWQQARDIIVHGRRAGRVEVCYLEERPESHEGPFLQEEGDLVNAIARHLGRIIERVKAQETLKRSEERFAMAERAANVGSWDWDIQTGELHWSDQIEPLFGLARGEFGGTYEAFLERVDPEDRQYVVDAVNASVAGERDYAVEHRVVWPDGTVRWVSEAGDVIRDEGGRALRMVGVVRDITERKQAEVRIRQQNEFLTSILESVTQPLYVVDVADHTVTMANSAAYSGSLPEHATCYALFHGRSRPCAEVGDRCPIEEIKRTKQPATAEHVHYNADGNRRTIEVRGYPLFDEEGNVTDVIEYCLDITQRRRMEEALRAAKDAAEGARREEQRRRREAERRRQIAEGLADVLAALNSNQPLDQILDHVAEKASELLDTQAVAICQLEGGPESFAVAAARCLPPDSAGGVESLVGVEAMVQAATLRQAVAVPELAADPTQSAPGAEQPVPEGPDAQPFRALLAVPIIVQDEVYGGLMLYYTGPRPFSGEEVELAAVFSDQIALAVENARLRERIKQAAAGEERSRLARDLHDSVTQALFSASLVAETLPRVWQRDPEEAQDGLEELRDLTRGALAEMRTLLLELRPTALVETRLDDLVLQLTEGVTSRVQLHVAVDTEPSPTLPPDVHVAFYRLAQEALHNAVKHAEASQLSVSLRAVPPVSRPQADDWQGQVVLHVSDNGQGFDADQTRGDQMGLGIMRERAETVGATLTIESQPDHGTDVILVWDNTTP